MLSDIIKSIAIFIAILGIIGCFVGPEWGSYAIVIGSLGWVFAAVSVPIKMDDVKARRNRHWMADDLATWGYCPMGYRGVYDADKITTRCKGEDHDKCKACIQMKMGDEPVGKIRSIAEYDEWKEKQDQIKKEVQP